MNNELENLTNKLQEESHFDINPVTETTIVDFEDWILFNENMMRKFPCEKNIYYQNISNRGIIAYIHFKYNILGYMLHPTAYYNGQLLESKSVKFTDIKDFDHMFNNKQAFIYNIKYFPTYPVIADDKIQLLSDETYWILRYATLEN